MKSTASEPGLSLLKPYYLQFHALAPEQENDLILCCVLEFCMAKVPAWETSVTKRNLKFKLTKYSFSEANLP